MSYRRVYVRSLAWISFSNSIVLEMCSNSSFTNTFHVFFIEYALVTHVRTFINQMSAAHIVEG